jgi:calcineurin-like phosphoesterase family protein
MRTFFVADTHFGHANIIRLTSRPFPGVEAMDAEMAARWNAAVAPGDTVWHLGDFAVRCKPPRLQALFASLNGRKRLVAGNHDDDGTLRLGWDEVHREAVRVAEGGQRLLLGHYPLLEWDGFWRGVVHLHGHTHNSIPSTRRRADLGVEAWDYHPVQLADVLARMAALPDPDPRALPDQQIMEQAR